MIQHTQLNTPVFAESIKLTTPYLNEKAGGIRNLMTSKLNIDRILIFQVGTLKLFTKFYRHENH